MTGKEICAKHGLNFKERVTFIQLASGIATEEIKKTASKKVLDAVAEYKAATKASS